MPQDSKKTALRQSHSVSRLLLSAADLKRMLSSKLPKAIGGVRCAVGTRRVEVELRDVNVKRRLVPLFDVDLGLTGRLKRRNKKVCLLVVVAVKRVGVIPRPVFMPFMPHVLKTLLRPWSKLVKVDDKGRVEVQIGKARFAGAQLGKVLVLRDIRIPGPGKSAVLADFKLKG